MTSTRIACIKSEQDKLTLLEYAICDVLDKQYWRDADVQKDSVLAWGYFRPGSNDLRIDEQFLRTAQLIMRSNNLDSTSFYHNLTIAYENTAIRYMNKNNKDSACLYVKLLADLPNQDTIVASKEWAYLDKICNEPKILVPNYAPSFTQEDTPKRTFTEPNKDNKRRTQQNTNQSPVVLTPPNVLFGRDSQKKTTQTRTDDSSIYKSLQLKDRLADLLSISISGLQKDAANIGESISVNYMVSNDGEKVMEKVTLRFMLNNKEVSKSTLEPIGVGATKRGVGYVVIPKNAKAGQQTVTIIAEWQGQTLQSNSRTLNVGEPPKSQKKY